MFSHLYTRGKSDIGKEFLGHKTSLTPPRFIEVSVSSQKSES